MTALPRLLPARYPQVHGRTPDADRWSEPQGRTPARPQPRQSSDTTRGFPYLQGV